MASFFVNYRYFCPPLLYPVKKIIYLLCCLAAGNAYAQSNYQQSTVITTGHDTLRGWIDYKEWDKNPETFRFADNPSGRNPRIYTIREVAAFTVKGKDYFERAVISKSMDKTEPLEDLSLGADHTVVQDTLWLRQEYTGRRLGLYVYQDKLKTRYYIREAGAPVYTELVYRRYYVQGADQSRKLMTDHRYRQQLMAAAAQAKGLNTAALSEMLYTSDYTDQSLGRAVAFINGNEKPVRASRSKSKWDFYAGLALTASKARYSGTHELANNASGKLSVLPGLSAGIDFLTNPYVKKVLVRLDLSLTLANADVSKPMGIDGKGYEKHRFDQYNIALGPMVIYNLYNKEQLKFNLGLGASFNYSIYSNNVYEQKYNLGGPGGTFNYEKAIKMDPFWFGVPVRAGLILRGHFDIYAQYNVIISPVASFKNYSIGMQTFRVGINYLLQ